MGTIAGWLFAGATTALFAWGLWLGLRGVLAEHKAWLSFGHAPGAPGTYDSRHARPGGTRAA